MSVLPIRVLGDPILREETTVVAEVTDDVRTLIDDMFETMYAAAGIGLAAPQVGRSERVAVVDVDGEKYALVNPEVSASSGRGKTEEGCLSIPDIHGDVERPTKVTITAIDRHGKPFDVTAEGLLARCFQHEIDHLHGRLFIDYLGPFKRRAAMNKWARERDQYPGNIRILTPGEIAKNLKDDHPHDEDM